nr:hypothetical protein [Tanacetum cinerariifolium]
MHTEQTHISRKKSAKEPEFFEDLFCDLSKVANELHQKGISDNHYHADMDLNAYKQTEILDVSKDLRSLRPASKENWDVIIKRWEQGIVFASVQDMSETAANDLFTDDSFVGQIKAKRLASFALSLAEVKRKLRPEPMEIDSKSSSSLIPNSDVTVLEGHAFEVR